LKCNKAIDVLIKQSLFFQPVRFKLNHNSTRLLPGERDHSIWVGDLTPEVDDLQFYKFFAARFQTVKSAKGKYYFPNLKK
jgi:hypothetical protein